jgi:hypothetical protein
MGFFTLGRTTHHAFTTVTIKGVEIEIVIEGSLDHDEHYFELDTVYLQEPRAKTKDTAPFALPERIYNKLTSGAYDEQFHDVAWASA